MSKQPAWVWVVLTVIACTVFFGAIVAGGLAAYVHFSKPAKSDTLVDTPPPVGRARAGKAEKQTYARDEFAALILGKTKAELLELFGKPYRTEGSAPDDGWTYEEITFDPINSKLDSLTWIRFSNGKVVGIDY